MKKFNYNSYIKRNLLYLTLIVFLQGCLSKQIIISDMIGKEVEIVVQPIDNKNKLTQEKFMVSGKILEYDNGVIKLDSQFYIKKLDGSTTKTHIIPIGWIEKLRIAEPEFRD